MIRLISHQKMGRSSLGWLESWFHFSFAEYYNPDNINYGVLRVINDDTIRPGTGFDLHPHRDMEIVTYVIDGELTHADSMNNQRTLKRGDVQYMSAGTGVVHSEHNLGEKPLRLLQIWILPDRRGYEPQYGDYRFSWDDRLNRWLHIVSEVGESAPIQIHQDINLYASALCAGKELTFEIHPERQVYLVQIEGSTSVNGRMLTEKDAAEAAGESLTIRAETDSHLLLFEMARDIGGNR